MVGKGLAFDTGLAYNYTGVQGWCLRATSRQGVGSPAWRMHAPPTALCSSRTALSSEICTVPTDAALRPCIRVLVINGRSALSAACCVPAPPISLALAPAGPKSGLASVPMAAAGSLLILLYSWKPALKLPCLFSWRWLHRSTLFASNRRRFRPGETREIQPVHPVPALAQALALLMRASSRN